MKDNRFIELVNLYIDRQISAVETADLEAEMQASPSRRAIYRQYCQLHRATTLVYESFRTDAPEKAGAAKADRLEHSERRHGSRWTYYAGSLAAACLALVFVRLNSTSTAGTSSPVALVKASPVAVVAAHPPAAAVKSSPATERTILAGSPTNNLAGEQDYAAMLAAMRRQDQQSFANGQLQSPRLPSLFDDGVFESQHGFPANSTRVFRSKQSPAQQTEFTAFQFQR